MLEEIGSALGVVGWPTSAVFGTLSQKTSILMLPAVVCSVTDMVAARFGCS